MLSKRVMVVAPDKALQKRLAASAMAAGGAVQTFAAYDEVGGRIEADLALCAVAPRQAGAPATIPAALASLAARLPDGARLVPILPAPDLEWMVALLADPRVPCVLVGSKLDGSQITETVAKLLAHEMVDLFGVEKLMPWGVRVYSTLVSDYHEKTAAIATIGEFAQAMGVRRKYREQIDQCVDEMLMNGLYDAPVDADGKPLFADVPVRERVLMRVDEKAVVQYACDGERFVVSVRDGFGTLRKETVLFYLDKCLHAPNPIDQIDRKAGGAGLGLYLIANSATDVSFHIFAGSATEVVCSFDLGAVRAQLHSLAVYEEQIAGARAASRHTNDNAGARPALTTVSTRPGRRREDLVPPPTRSSALPVMMTFAVLLLAFAVGLAALPYLRRPAAAALQIETDPIGALIYVDGRARGAAPLRVDAEAGRSYALRAVRPGYRDDEQLVAAAAGDSTVRLALPQLRATLVVETEPAGARVLIDGEPSGKLTPATLDLAPATPLKLTLQKDGFVDHSVATVAPAAGEKALYHAALPLGPGAALLTIVVTPANANVSVDGMTLMPPAPSHDTFVAPGVRHKIKAGAPGYVDSRQEVIMAGGEHKSVQLHLIEGATLVVRSNIAAKVLVDDKPVGNAPLLPIGITVGEHRLALRGKAPDFDYVSPISVAKGQTLDVRLEFKTDHTVVGHIGDKSVSDRW